MTDLRKAAEMALEFIEWFASDDHSVKPTNKAPEIAKALRQALAEPDQSAEYWKEQYHKMKNEVERLSLDLGIKEKFFNQGEVK